VTPALDPVATLRDRVVVLRDDLRQRLAVADALDAGLLALLADAETVIAALDRDGEDDPSSCSSPHRRGGDPHAERRRELHDGLRGMASLLGLGKGKPAAEVAREITDRCKRYQPMPVETDPVRREMLRVRNAGVPVPASERHLIRIISGPASSADGDVVCFNGTTGQAGKTCGAQGALNALPGNPNGTTSPSPVMMGLGSSCTVTPNRSGKVLFIISGTAQNSASGDGWFYQIRYGTGGRQLMQRLQRGPY
jgi:hypothetical protein